MNTGRTATHDWERLRTPETRALEEFLREHFQEADAYRFNSASIRVRIVDERFRDRSAEERDDLVEPVLSRLEAAPPSDLLSPETNAEILTLVLLFPGEEAESSEAMLLNLEFEHPSESLL